MACGFVKNLRTPETGAVSFTLQLTTPACPVKDEFRRLATEYVGELEWVEKVAVELTAAPAAASDSSSVEGRPGGLARVRHVIAVSSCKGGVGKSTVAVNLAYTLAQMGAAVGIMDADVYGPSLPTMTSPTDPVLKADPETGTLTPATYMGVSLVSFGFAGQGAAIMRGPMASGVVAQLLTQTDWGALDYLVVDFPPGTGDIQLTLCQVGGGWGGGVERARARRGWGVGPRARARARGRHPPSIPQTVQFSAAVVVTTPQKLAYVDVAKGVRMFARVAVPCVAVAENMATFTGDDGTLYRPFGAGAGARIQAEFGVPHVVRFPIEAALAAAGDGGVPLAVADPASAIGDAFMELGGVVVREVARLAAAGRASVRCEGGEEGRGRRRGRGHGGARAHPPVPSLSPFLQLRPRGQRLALHARRVAPPARPPAPRDRARGRRVGGRDRRMDRRAGDSRSPGPGRPEAGVGRRGGQLRGPDLVGGRVQPGWNKGIRGGGVGWRRALVRRGRDPTRPHAPQIAPFEQLDALATAAAAGAAAAAR